MQTVSDAVLRFVREHGDEVRAAIRLQREQEKGADATPSREALLAQVAALRASLEQVERQWTKAKTDDVFGRWIIDIVDPVLADTAAAAAEHERAIIERCAARLLEIAAEVRKEAEKHGIASRRGQPLITFAHTYESAADKVRALATPTEPSR